MCQLFHPTAYLSITLKEFISDNKLNVALILGWIIHKLGFILQIVFTFKFINKQQQKNKFLDALASLRPT